MTSVLAQLLAIHWWSRHLPPHFHGWYLKHHQLEILKNCRWMAYLMPDDAPIFYDSALEKTPYVRENFLPEWTAIRLRDGSIVLDWMKEQLNFVFSIIINKHSFTAYPGDFPWLPCHSIKNFIFLFCHYHNSLSVNEYPNASANVCCLA